MHVHAGAQSDDDSELRILFSRKIKKQMEYGETKTFKHMITLEIFLCIIVHITCLYSSTHSKYLYTQIHAYICIFTNNDLHMCVHKYKLISQAHLSKGEGKWKQIEGNKHAARREGTWQVRRVHLTEKGENNSNNNKEKGEANKQTKSRAQLIETACRLAFQPLVYFSFSHNKC